MKDVVAFLLSRYPNCPLMIRRLLSSRPDNMPSYSALLKPSSPVLIFAPNVQLLFFTRLHNNVLICWLIVPLSRLCIARLVWFCLLWAAELLLPGM